MCAFCGLFGNTNPSWFEARPDNGPARAARLSRIKRANELFSMFRLTLSDQHGAYYVLSGATGKTEVINSLSEAWPAAERILGKRLDPLSVDLLNRLEVRNEGTKSDSI
jgi:hypothetical protein